MQSIYWITFVAGGIFVFLAAIGGIDGAEFDLASEVDIPIPDADLSGGLDQDIELVDAPTPSSRAIGYMSPLVLLTSFKFWTFGTCFFGLTGLLISWIQPQRGPVSTFFIALLMGLLIGGIVSAVFQSLKTRIPNSLVTEDELVGRLATVELPINQNTRGKIRVQIGDGNREIPARTNDSHNLKVGDAVMIIGLEGNLAWVVSENSLKDAPIE